jgi:D-3-phosphoglycerate dehydrogenase
MSGPSPIVLFVDHGFPIEPFAQALAPGLECRAEVAPDERDRVLALVTGAVPVTAGDAAAYPALALVLTCSIGVDHLDVGGLQALGLTVCNTPTYCTDEVADHTIACLLAGWRGLWRLGDEVRAGQWRPETVLRRFDRQRLGIIGLGRIGRAVARRAQALSIEVVAYGPRATPQPGVELLGLDELLAGSDAVSLHLPGTPGAPPLLGAAEIAAMKPGAVLINQARAGVVDLEAVLAALRSGALAGAAFDVWPQEPPGDDPRLQTPGLLVTPHVGWSSPEADVAYAQEAIDTLRTALTDGGEPAGLIRAVTPALSPSTRSER